MITRDEILFQPGEDTSIPPTPMSSEEIFDEHGKLVIFAYLSLAAYYDVGTAPEFGPEESAYDWIRFHGLELITMSTLGLPNSGTTGLYASDNDLEVLVSRSTDGIFISFRGTEFSTVADWRTDFSLISESQSRYSHMQPLFDALFEYAYEQNITQFHVTGHSLGAGLAEIFMQGHEDGFLHQQSYADTGYLGAEFIAHIFSTPGVNNYGTWHDTRVTAYSHDGDPINSVSYVLGSSARTIEFVTMNPQPGPIDAHSIEAMVSVARNLKHAGTDITDDEIDFIVNGQQYNTVNLFGVFDDGDFGFFGILSSGIDPNNFDHIDFVGGIFADAIIGGGGNDQIYGYGGADYLVGGAGEDVIFGGSGVDFMRGGDGHDILHGGTNADIMYGGDGNDAYVVDEMDDEIHEEIDEGIDTVYAYETHTLFDNVENIVSLLVLDGSVISGNTLNNIIIMNAVVEGASAFGGGGNDLIYAQDFTNMWGEADNDSLVMYGHSNTAIGGTGNDIYFLSDANNTLVEEYEGGYDTVYATGHDHTLAANIEVLVLVGAYNTQTLSGTGNSGRNTIIGTDGYNILAGGGDVDFIVAGGHDDFIIGGAGADVLQGNAGDDYFYYNAPSEGGDTIQDWVSGEDQFVFAATPFGVSSGYVLTEGYNFISGENPASVAGLVTILWDSDDTALYLDPDGTGGYSAVLIADLQAYTTVEASDFVFF